MIDRDGQAMPGKQYPRAYFAAPVHFAARIAAITGMALVEAIETYTGLSRELVGKPPGEAASDPIWVALTGNIAHKSDPEAISDVVYGCYCAQSHSAYDPNRNREDAHVFGAMGYTYFAEARQVRTHFFPAHSTESALARKYVAERRDDFRRLLGDVRQRHPDATEVKSSSWLQSLPNYRELFPAAFSARLRDVGGGSYIGVWGQFVKGDGSANVARLAEFKAGLAAACTVDEAIAAIPLKVLEGVGPIQDFYDEYGV